MSAPILDHAALMRWRLRNQRLTGSPQGGALEVVAAMLAVQAENPAQSAWAVAARTGTSDPGDLAALLRSGEVVRVHALRSTWHYLAAADAGWALDLTSRQLMRNVEIQLEFSGEELSAISELVATLVAERAMTRPELAAELAERGWQISGHGLMTQLAWQELRQQICSGPPANDGEHTYAEFGNRIRNPRRPERDEALGELVVRYLTGHGPATLRDLCYWATQTVTDLRRGVEVAANSLARFEFDGSEYWHLAGDEPPATSGEPAGHLLQILDELYRGYQDSRWLLDAEGLVPRGRESSMGMAVAGHQLVSWMRRTVSAKKVRFDLTPLRELTGSERRLIEDAAVRYGDFLGVPAEVVG